MPLFSRHIMISTICVCSEMALMYIVSHLHPFPIWCYKYTSSLLLTKLHTSTLRKAQYFAWMIKIMTLLKIQIIRWNFLQLKPREIVNAKMKKKWYRRKHIYMLWKNCIRHQPSDSKNSVDIQCSAQYAFLK